ncbi:hypothetical protein CYMTET_40282 [Cymbomonas tetramitiformis]|uniref:Uncharacterized protein n=1 Tax=Cymbomonas tetramitiformis TaxID=36881 RepID=A0AAE0F3E7_9CHLO|nr:hypothetical protein CYMTET_40282 [Cymbomonas tetramitiformis]
MGLFGGNEARAEEEAEHEEACAVTVTSGAGECHAGTETTVEVSVAQEIQNVKHKKQSAKMLGSKPRQSGEESVEKEGSKSSDDEDVAPLDDAGAEVEGGDGLAGDLELPIDEEPDGELKESNMTEDPDESSGGEAYDEHVEKEKDY